MEPLKSRRLDPLRAVGDAARVHQERGAHAKHEGRVKERKIAVHEFLLLRRAQSNPYDVWPCAVNGLDKLMLLVHGHWAERRGNGADDAKRREPGEKRLLQFCRQTFLAAAQQVPAVPETRIA